MTNRSDRSTRRSRWGASRAGDNLPPKEAQQQVESFVDVLADLLTDEAAVNQASSARRERRRARAHRDELTREEAQTKADSIAGSITARSPYLDWSDSDKPSPEVPVPPLPLSSPDSPSEAGEAEPAAAPPAVAHEGLDNGTEQNSADEGDTPLEAAVSSGVAPEPQAQPDLQGPLPAAPPVVLDPKPTTVETTALVLHNPSEATPGGTSDTPVDAESVGGELNNLRTLLVGMEEQFYDTDKLMRLMLPAVTEAIRNRLKTRRSAIASVLRSEMSVPIEEQIAVERDAIIDALYPVIGSTLAEYFTETLRTINSHVAGNTPEAVPPEAAGETPPGLSVQALVLVHQATGLVMAQAIANKELTRTAARRTELLTAIRSAAAARLAQPQLSGQTGKYRQGQILVELSEHCYLAALLQGEPPVSFLRQMGHLLKAIVTDHGEAITAFEGDADTVPGTIAQRLHRLMRINTGGHQRRRPARLAAIGLLILGGIAASVLGLQELRDRRLAALTAQVERTADLLNQGSGVSITARTSDNQVVLEGNVLQFNEVENIRQAFAEIDGVEGVIDQIETQPRTVSTQIYFYPNSATISPRDVANKIVNITQLLSQYPEFNLRIIGYHNPADEGEVQELALDRALAVADALADQGVLRQRLEVVEGEGTPPGVNAERQPWLSRAVLFEIVPPLAGLSDGAS